jgi:hypothetical protein
MSTPATHIIAIGARYLKRVNAKFEAIVFDDQARSLLIGSGMSRADRKVRTVPLRTLQLHTGGGRETDLE